MAHKGPHVSISAAFVVNRILRINLDEYESWPTAVQQLASQIAEELFLVAYNPFISAQTVKNSVDERFERESHALAHVYVTAISEGMTMFWSAHDAEVSFRKELVERLGELMPKECIITRPGALVETSTDATDLRMELPLLVVEPDNIDHIIKLVHLANEMKFALIPRGGGSGMTGGAVPARKRSVIVNMTRLTKTEVDVQNKTMLCEAGVITQDAINKAAEYKLLFTVDPASKTASSIGGNIAENSGGPFCFEYGTTLDNLLSWRMVTPTGELIRIERVCHPHHKILETEIATFEVRDDDSGGLRSVIELRGDEIRLPGLGKDVTNKVLGGLPGMQKEGVDGLIIDAVFTLHDQPKYSRVLALEFFGRSMKPAAELINKIVELRNRIRNEGDYVRVSALEEFNVKYVQAIEYKRKSPRHEGDPISVIIVQVDGNDEILLDDSVKEILALVGNNEYIYAALAKDKKESELFWEDRHKLSAIAKRTSGFKMNEDVVIPMPKIPDFAHFLELLNLEMAGKAYRYALQEVGRLQGFPMQDTEFNKEFSFASKIAGAEDSIFEKDEIEFSDDELIMRATLFIDSLGESYQRLREKIQAISQYMRKSRIIIASHMHAGDGNCHVNIPVNSNDPHMMENAEEAVLKVMETAKKMGGAVSGEHGIGITKINFLERNKIKALRAFKERVDPREILNPGKLVQQELPVRPFTFSFNRLIEDIKESGLADKERFIELLSTMQACTRCGKCKQVCPMVYPERSYQYHPRNKNMILGAITEAIYYTQATKGKIDSSLLEELRFMVEHCTGCGRCTSVCPVKIESAKVALAMLAFLKEEGMGGHPIKSSVLNWLSGNPQSRIPTMAKAAAVGQKVGNTVLGFVPKMWRDRFESPLFSGKGPNLGMHSMYNELNLEKGGYFVPQAKFEELKQSDNGIEAVLYFPGCGGSLFYRKIGLATINLLTQANIPVIVPEQHLCCGYPLLSSGADGNYKENLAKNQEYLTNLIKAAEARGLHIRYLITACGSCRDSLQRYELTDTKGNLLTQKDFMQFISEQEHTLTIDAKKDVVYHASCHPEWAGIKAVNGGKMASRAIEKISGSNLTLSPGCCGESGTGAYSSPGIYNALRERKKNRLVDLLPNYMEDSPIIVGCPSCKIGISRTLLKIKEDGYTELAKHPVLHSAEWLSELMFGEQWLQNFKKEATKIDSATNFRIIEPMSKTNQKH